MKSTRARALLSLGIILGLGSVSTLAYWTDEATLAAGTIQSGSLDLKLDGADNLPSTTKLAITNLVPGESVAATVNVQRAPGTVAFTYSVTGKVNETHELATGLRFKLFAGAAGTSSANGNGIRTQSCGGTQLAGGTDGIALSTATDLVTNRTALATPSTVQPAAVTENLCIQAILPSTAGNGTQSKSATATFAFNATQLS